MFLPDHFDIRPIKDFLAQPFWGGVSTISAILMAVWPRGKQKGSPSDLAKKAHQQSILKTLFRSSSHFLKPVQDSTIPDSPNLRVTQQMQSLLQPSSKKNTVKPLTNA